MELKESELRKATVMFADISGFTAMSERMLPEEITGIMNKCFDLMGSVIEGYGGTIDKFMGDCIMSVFGVPVAIERAPYKAVAAALQIREKLYLFNKNEKLKIPLNVHIGINSGDVLAGVVGSTGKKEYTVMGDTVNLASRIENVSESGQILVGYETWKLIRDDFNFIEMEPVKMKGKSEKVSIFGVANAVIPVHKHSQIYSEMIRSIMIGRDDEIDKLEFLILQAKKGQGNIANIIGEAGIGKSRLIEEIKISHSIKNTNLLRGYAVSMGQNLSFHPLVKMFKDWSEIIESDDEICATNKLKDAIYAILKDQVDDIYPFIARFLGLNIPGQYLSKVDCIEGVGFEKIIYKNLRDLIVNISEQAPLIIILEDLHWADKSTMELLQKLYLLIKEFPILFINLFRPNYEETSNVILELTNKNLSDNVTNLYLEPLDEKDGKKLIGNLTHLEGLPESIKQTILERAGGNPFFIEEIIRLLQDEGIISENEEKNTLINNIDIIHIPSTIQEIVMSRMDRLEDSIKDLVKVASVIGQSFFEIILCEVSGHIDDIKKKISYLKNIQLIKESNRLEETEYLFKHALARDAIYESLLLNRRKELHRKTAEAIEKVFFDKLNEFYGVLAFHYDLGGELNKTEYYMMKAGEEALKASASAEAISYCRIFLEMYKKNHKDNIDLEKIADNEAILGQAYLNKGNYSESLKYYDSAFLHYGYREPKNKVVIALLLGRNILIILRMLYLPYKRPKKIPDQEVIDYFRIFFHRALSMLHKNTKRWIFSNILVLHNATRYNFSGSQIMFNCLCGITNLFYPLGFFKFMERFLLFVLKFHYNEERVSLYYYNLLVLVANTLKGNWSFEYHVEDYLDCIQHGDFHSVYSTLKLYGLLFLRKGQFVRLHDLIGKFGEFIVSYNLEGYESSLIELQAKFYLQKNNLKMALLYIQNAINKSLHLNDKSGFISYLGLKIIIEIRKNDLESASKTISLLEKEINNFGFVMPHFYMNYAIGSLLYHLEFLKNAYDKKDKQLIRRYKRIAWEKAQTAIETGKKCAFIRVESQQLMARYFKILKAERKALKWYRNAIETGKQMKSNLNLAETYQEVGEYLQNLDNKLAAEEYFDKAEILYQQMDLQWKCMELKNIRLKHPA